MSENKILYKVCGEFKKWGTCESDWTENAEQALQWLQEIEHTHENPRVIKRTEESIVPLEFWRSLESER